MNFGLLAPIFMAGLALLAIPVLVHLTHRERKEPVEWPSLMFLQRIEYRAARRQRIRHWLLLLMRAAALALVVMAFARPFMRGAETAATAAGGPVHLVVLLDRSHSMQYGDRFARAQEAARSAVRGLSPDDLVSVVLFDEATAAPVSASLDKNAAGAAIDAARASDRGTRYAPAVRLAGRLMTDAEIRRREVVLISDFQRRGWSGEDEARLPGGAELRTVDVGAPESPNASVAGLEMARETSGSVERARITARLTSTFGDARTVAATLLLNGREIERREVSLAPDGATRVGFSPATLPAGITRGEVRIGADDLTADDAFFFTIAAGEDLPVLIVESDGAAATSSLYLSRALAIGDAPGFRTRTVQSGRLTTRDLADAAVIIFNDAPPPRAELARALAARVNEGAGLLVVAGPRAEDRAWPAELEAIMPAAIGAVADRPPGRPGAIGFMDRSHPALTVFRAPRSGDFAAARFLRYRTLRPADGTEILARFDDGAAALVERRAGTGRVLVLASTIDGVWNDLPVQPVFLPLVHQIARYAAGYAERRRWYTIGEVVDLTRDPSGIAADSARGTLIAVSPSGKRTHIPPDRRPVLELGERGFHELRRESNGRTVSLAANVAIGESDLSRIDPEELSLAIAAPPRDSLIVESGEIAAAGLAEPPPERHLWWWLLAAALLLFVGETVLGNRLSRFSGVA
ncbi:MAG TPA: BatA domain-containing protein [Gemmatimonadaceae bacterium]|nr:BatA domain-containing protein [Gemmatimonadaceae bacterium]